MKQQTPFPIHSFNMLQSCVPKKDPQDLQTTNCQYLYVYRVVVSDMFTFNISFNLKTGSDPTEFLALRSWAMWQVLLARRAQRLLGVLAGGPTNGSCGCGTSQLWWGSRFGSVFEAPQTLQIYRVDGTKSNLFVLYI